MTPTAIITKLGTAICGRGEKKILEKDLVLIKKYQLMLLDYYLYETEEKKDYRKRKLIMFEIKECEVWLKKQYTDFINNNNRKFELAL